MRQDIQNFVDETMPCQVSFRLLATMLPKDDAELDAMLEECIGRVDGRAAPYILFAALSANRKIDARHIQGSAMLITGYINFLTVAWKLEGDVPKYIMAALRPMALDMQIQAASFFLMAAWEAEGRGPTPREEAIIAARLFSRKLPPTSDAIFLMVAAAHLWKDEGLKDVLSSFHTPIPEEKITALINEYLRICKRPVLEGVAVRPDGNLTHGKTMRRSVAPVGRNEPCPCGSGKKYKQCCINKDNLRLQQSTEIEGVTRAELRENLEQHVNSLRLARCNPPDLLKFDPRKLARFLLKPYFERLARFRMMDKVAESFEQLGWSDDLIESWNLMMYWSHYHHRKDVADRLLKIAPEPYEVDKALYAGYRLLLYEDRPTKMMEILLDHAKLTLRDETPDTLQSFAMGLLPTKLSAVGILVARGVLPFLSDEDAQIVYNEILRARDLMNLPPDDLYSDIMDERLTKKKENEPDDSESLNEAKQKLEDKAKEVRQMKEVLHQLQREISLREKKTDPVIAENVVQFPGKLDEGAMSDLRNKVETLKSELKERHNERNELRRELQKAHTDIEQLRHSFVPSETEKARARDEEESLLLPEENVGQQPVRLIEFPKKFEERLASFPRHVARNAMKTLGELAGGETSAFVGAVRLKAIPSITRQRIGIDVRLLFKVLPDRLQVVDLVNRKDLERRIKSLLSSPH